jgi:uncharacterized protein
MPKSTSHLSTFNFDLAKQYALYRLEQELSSHHYYHNMAHTVDDVIPAVERLSYTEGIEEEPRLLLLTAAYYHDIGFIESRHEHETIGIRIAAAVLPDFGYDPAQIEIVTGIIMATHLPQAPRNQLEAILADADLDVLGRPDFLDKNNDLRAEWEFYGLVTDDLTWYEGQVGFMQEHDYFTAAARQLRNARKRENIRLLQELIANC